MDKYESIAATDLLCLAILDEGINYQKVTDPAPSVLKKLDKYCYIQAKLYWKVINRKDQFIVVVGGYSVSTLIDKFYKDSLRYKADSWIDATSNWDDSPYLNGMVKFQKCNVIRLEVPVFDNKQIEEINRTADKKIKEYYKRKNK